jgi:predicted DNA-binding protein (MmcQ/YjbR family)
VEGATVRIAAFNAFCRKLPHTTRVVQWGGAHVWKVAGKVFAICWDGGGDDLAITFKCSPMSYDMLCDVSGCRPAPYLASRGMKWIQRFDESGLDDAGLRDYLAASHRLVSSGLPKKVQKELGFPTETGRPTKRAARSSATTRATRSAP